jgi:lysozyme
MRSIAIFSILTACLATVGCTSHSSRSSSQVPPPSQEITYSITRPSGPVPLPDVGPVGSDELLAARQQPSAVSGDSPQPPEPIALVPPSKPAVGPAPLSKGKVFGRRFRDAKPVNFGSASPKSLPVHGVDVSRWQGDIDWSKLRSQGANFVYIKATDGGDHLDPRFNRNWRAAGAAGLRRGAYHFFYWCRTAGEQAAWFIRNVPKVQGALPPVIDVEWNGDSRTCKKRPSRARVVEKMQVFMDKLEKHYGQRPVIYTSPDFHDDNLEGQFNEYTFWLRSVAAHPAKTYPGRKWMFWQYSGSGLSHGVKGRIDLNVFNGNEDAWHSWLSEQAG